MSEVIKGKEKELSHIKSPNLYQERAGYGLPEEESSYRDKVTLVFISLILTCPLTR